MCCDVSSYVFRLVAVDGGEPRRSGSLEVVVSVTDVNDNSPTFSRTSLEARVREDSAMGTVICRVTAHDSDEQLNSELRYRFTDETRRQYGATFDIRPDTGAVVVVGALDYETRHDYSLYVLATDRAGVDSSALTGMVSIIVRVDDVNDHAPDIAFNFRYSATDHRQPPDDPPRDVVADQPYPVVKVNRAASVGTFVAHVTVRDSDDGENGWFRCVLLSLNSTAGNRFAMHQIYDTEYTIVTTGRLDELAARRDSVTLDVYCADGGRPTLTSESRLVVMFSDDVTADHDEDMRRDVFRKKVVRIAVADSVPLGTAIYCPGPSEMDVNSVFKSAYRITDVSTSTSGRSALRFLDVDTTSGMVRTKLALDLKYQCRLEVDLWKDVDGSSSRQSAVRLSVVVVDVSRWRHSRDDDAVVESRADVSYEFSVAENSPGGTYVGSVSASDLCLPTSDNEHDDQVVYELFGSESSALSELFHVDADTGRLTTLTPLDRETRGDYTLLVLARLSSDVTYVDAAGCQLPAVQRRIVIEALARLHINVIDINDHAPTFEFPSPGNDVIALPSTATSGHVVTRVIARDKDAGLSASISYHIQSQSDWAKAFNIDRSTGPVVVVVINLLSSSYSRHHSKTIDSKENRILSKIIN